MLPHPTRMCKHMRWGFMQRFLRAFVEFRVNNIMGALLRSYSLISNKNQNDCLYEFCIAFVRQHEPG